MRSFVFFEEFKTTLLSLTGLGAIPQLRYFPTDVFTVTSNDATRAIMDACCDDRISFTCVEN